MSKCPNTERQKETTGSTFNINEKGKMPLKKKCTFLSVNGRKLSFKTPEPVKTDLHYFI